MLKKFVAAAYNSNGRKSRVSRWGFAVHELKKLRTIMTTSARVANTKNGIVNFVGRAARFLITTKISDIIAAMINVNEAPLKSTNVMVAGKIIAAINVTEIPTHAT